ncbi:MAG: sulfite exporter TauE/SafE family protein [Planctomycetes bacterium]|nr:sulfite exporter TauE/SafE family protein [Planctomycetota bacterium]
MDPLAITLIAITGLVMGFVNNLAGAGGALALLSFELVAHLAPDAANAAMRPAAFAIGLGGWLGFALHRQRVPARAFLYGLATLPGALLGTWFAIELPDQVYDLALLVVIAILVVGLVRERRGAPPPKPASPGLATALFVAVGIHMGFLQVGVGLLAIAALRRVGDRDLVRVNASKMALILCSSATSIASFTAARAIPWGPALTLAAGALVGSFLGSVFAVRRGHRAVLAFVLVVAVVVLARTAFRLALSIGGA